MPKNPVIIWKINWAARKKFRGDLDGVLDSRPRENGGKIGRQIRRPGNAISKNYPRFIRNSEKL
ncbi:MAG: hypothetical protein HAW59_06570 [Betaproteobacteria bacterium]|nr:hypothetical protein [Betaproteobacteria bacterium]